MEVRLILIAVEVSKQQEHDQIFITKRSPCCEMTDFVRGKGGAIGRGRAVGSGQGKAMLTFREDNGLESCLGGRVPRTQCGGR